MPAHPCVYAIVTVAQHGTAQQRRCGSSSPLAVTYYCIQFLLFYSPSTISWPLLFPGPLPLPYLFLLIHRYAKSFSPEIKAPQKGPDAVRMTRALLLLLLFLSFPSLQRCRRLDRRRHSSQSCSVIVAVYVGDVVVDTSHVYAFVFCTISVIVFLSLFLSFANFRCHRLWP